MRSPKIRIGADRGIREPRGQVDHAQDVDGERGAGIANQTHLDEEENSERRVLGSVERAGNDADAGNDLDGLERGQVVFGWL